MSRNVRLALIQMRYPGSFDKAMDLAADRIRAAAAESANVVCLQELFHCAYPVSYTHLTLPTKA